MLVTLYRGLQLVLSKTIRIGGTQYHIYTTVLHSVVNTIGRAYVSNKEINKHALPITITKIRGGPILAYASS